MKPFHQMSTHWTKIEELKQKGELRELANYLAARYYVPLAEAFKKREKDLDEFQIYELTSDVFYEFFKNDYSKLKTIDKNKGRLKGLFYIIFKRKIYRLKKSKKTLQPPELEDSCVENYIDVFLDLENSLEKLKSERSLLYEPFILYTFQGKKMAEIGQILEIKEDAVKQRICSARKLLDKLMVDY